MSRRFLPVLLASFSLQMGAAWAAENIQVKPETAPIELVGEVVDAWCYASKSVGNGRGPEHKKCAQTCILGGVSAGIVDDKGNLYIAAKSRAYQGANHMLLPFTAKRVVVRGWVSRAGGSQLIKIDSVEEWKPGMKLGGPRLGNKAPEQSAEVTKATEKKLLEMVKESKTIFPSTQKKPDKKKAEK